MLSAGSIHYDPARPASPADLAGAARGGRVAVNLRSSPRKRGPILDFRLRRNERSLRCDAYGFHPLGQAGGVLPSIRMKAMRHGLPELLTQAWLVPCWTTMSPAFT